MSIDYNRIPPLVLATLKAYRNRGSSGGGFVNACLTNDLRGAVLSADPDSLAALKDIVAWLNNELPASAWGSQAAIEAWRAKRLFEGQKQVAAALLLRNPMLEFQGDD